MLQYAQNLADYIGFSPERKVVKLLNGYIDSNIEDFEYWDYCLSYDKQKHISKSVTRFLKQEYPYVDLLQGAYDKDIDVTEIVEKKAVSEVLADLISQIPEREGLCLKLRYDLQRDKARSLEEVGFCLGVSRERVRQIEKKALEHIKSLKGFAALCELVR